MIIFDYQQVAISNLMEQIGSSNGSVDENLVRHMILNTLRTYVKKFKATHGPEVIIACDNRHYWRREVYTHYKAGRKKARAATGHDWTSIFESLNRIRQELKESSPYKVIDVDGAEADDVIGTLVQKYASTEKIMILSSDKDFAQLQRFPNVEQFSPIMKKYIKEPFPLVQLKQLIIRGDKGDGIPNILSPDDVFVVGGRQKAITEVKIIAWLNQDPKEFCNDEMFRNYSRNETLIDLTKIPEKVRNEILEQYETAKGKTRQVFMNYMMKNRLKNLLECIDEF
jgi:5'-3' exonuclease